MKTFLALLAMTACLRVEAGSGCRKEDFFPASDTRANIDAIVADPKPEIDRDDEQPWFEFIDVGEKPEPGWRWVYEVSVLRSTAGAFRVSLLRARLPEHDNDPTPGVVDSRELPAALALRLHHGVIPLLSRTHYPQELVTRPPRVVLMGGSWFFATVSQLDGHFGELTGEGKPCDRDTDAGSVRELGRALHDYALHRIDAGGLEAPLERVEANARP